MTRIASLLVMLLIASCAARSVGTSNELVQARHTYAHAAASNAATDAPKSLAAARRTLAAAEEANRIDPGSQRERDLAFVAMRRAQAAIADANAQAAQRDAQTAREELRLAGERAGRAVDRAHADAEAARAQAEVEAVQRQAAEQNAATARDSLTQAEAERDRARHDRDEAVEAMRKLGEVSQRDQSLVLALPTELMFRSGRASLLPRAREKLDELAAALLSLGSDQTFVIEGHTDARGSERANYRLSRLRALAVRAYLIKQGVDADRIRAVGRGEAEPVASNEEPEGRANNRRVEIIVTPAAVSKR